MAIARTKSVSGTPAASDPQAFTPPPKTTVARAAADLAAWFKASARVLPWRTDQEGWNGSRVAEAGPAVSPGRRTGLKDPPRRDPYRTWIAEIMLQQTQVATVTAYYLRWMDRFPDVRSLAAAAEEEVLALWAGLGYYSRARNILDTARAVVAAHGGRFPASREELLGLKGIGEYTAGAIASLSFNLPEPILDGNLVRVFSRLYGLSWLPDSAAGKQSYWDLARTWVEAHEPALVNEGLMELGALVCTPRNPSCQACPLAEGCHARARGTHEDFPPAKRRKEVRSIRGFALIVRRGSEVLLYRPRKGELLADLLTFPVIPMDGVPTIPALKKAWAKALPGLPVPAFRPGSATIRHGITHHQFVLRIAEGEVGESAAWPEGYAWIEAEKISEALVSSFPRKIWEASAG